MILDGGTLATSGAVTDTMGTLTISSASIIDLGTGSTSELTFAASNCIVWTGVLSIEKWTGCAGGVGSAGQIFFPGFGSLTPVQLANITFCGYTSGAMFRCTCGKTELVPLLPLPIYWDMDTGNAGATSGATANGMVHCRKQLERQ